MRKVLLILWRIWFYVLSAFPVILLFIPLAIFLLLPNGYRHLYWVARNIWSPFVLIGMGFKIKRLNTFPPDNRSMILVANHTSYIDIMLMFRMRKKPFVFVGKKEIVKIPIFGYLYKKAVIMVDRSDPVSRFAVYGRANKMLDKGYNVCIFPEAHYWDDIVLLQEFKRGAFKIAIDNQLPIIPIIFYDLKLKHPWYPKFGSIGKLRVKVLDKINVDNLSENDIPSLTKKAFTIIKDELEVVLVFSCFFLNLLNEYF